MKFYNRTQGRAVGPVVRVADSFWLRMKGVLGEDPRKRNAGLWIVPCSAIHTLGMRFDLDIIFLDRALCVADIRRGVKPGCWGLFCGKAFSVVEFFSGFWDPSEIVKGDQMETRD